MLLSLSVVVSLSSVGVPQCEADLEVGDAAEVLLHLGEERKLNGDSASH